MMALNSLEKVIRQFDKVRNCTRCLIQSIQKKNLSNSKILYNTDDPIKYSKTKASKMTTEDTFFMKPNPAVLPIERYVILISVTVLLVYSTMLRKENKIDRILDGSFDYEEDDEIKILNALLHAKLKGLKTDELEKKLQMIRQQK